jgi:hypothetical protein
MTLLHFDYFQKHQSLAVPVPRPTTDGAKARDDREEVKKEVDAKEKEEDVRREAS